LVTALMLGGCFPVPSDLGGTRPPPDINGDGAIGEEPPVEPPENGDGNGDGESMVFDVALSAVSRNVSGITMDATLTVVLNEAEDIASVGEVTLRDTENTFNGTETVGTVGGVFLTAFEGTGPGGAPSFFDLAVGGDGTVTAEFVTAGDRSSNVNVFILPEGEVFRRGEVGVTFQVQAGSTFSFLIAGDRVTGELDLNGIPVSTTGIFDFYIGSFEGERRP
jgi:hypothetical protein